MLHILVWKWDPSGVTQYYMYFGARNSFDNRCNLIQHPQTKHYSGSSKSSSQSTVHRFIMCMCSFWHYSKRGHFTPAETGTKLLSNLQQQWPTVRLVATHFTRPQEDGSLSQACLARELNPQDVWAARLCPIGHDESQALTTPKWQYLALHLLHQHWCTVPRIIIMVVFCI